MVAKAEISPSHPPVTMLLSTDLAPYHNPPLSPGELAEQSALASAIATARQASLILSPNERVLRNRLRAELDSLQDIFLAIRPEVDSPTATNDIRYLGKAFVVGIAVLAGNNLDRQLAFAQTNHLGKGEEERIVMEKLAYAGELDVPFEGVTLRQFLSDSQNPEKLGQHYRFIISAALIGNDTEPNNNSPLEIDQILSQVSQIPIVASYPYEARAAIRRGAKSILALLSLFPKEIDSRPFSKKGMLDQSVFEVTTWLVNQMHNFTSEVFRTLLNPDSPHFPIVRKVMEDYQNRGPREAVMSLYVLGIRTLKEFSHLYRQAGVLASQEDENAPFFAAIRDVVANWVSTFKPNFGIFAADVLPLDNGGLERTSAYDSPTMVRLRTIVSDIFSRGARHEYSIDPKELSQNQFPLDSIQVKFQARPHQFQIVLNFKDGKGTQREMVLHFDARRESLEWTLLETPSQLPSLQALCMRITEQALLSIQKQVRASRSAATAVGIDRAARVVTKPSVNRGAGGSGLPAGKLGKRHHGRSPLEDMSDRKPASTSDRKGAHPPARDNHIGRIVVPEKPRWERMTGGLSHREQRMVNGALARLKKTSLHGLKGLASQRKNGILTYEVAVTTQLYIVLEEIPSKNGGAPSFRVVAIRRT